MEMYVRRLYIAIGNEMRIHPWILLTHACRYKQKQNGWCMPRLWNLCKLVLYYKLLKLATNSRSLYYRYVALCLSLFFVRTYWLCHAYVLRDNLIILHVFLLNWHMGGYVRVTPSSPIYGAQDQDQGNWRRIHEYRRCSTSI